MARIAGRERGIARWSEILVPRRKTAPAKMRTSDRMPREAAAMSAEMMPATAEMRTAKSVSAPVSAPMSSAVPAAMATTMTSAMAAAASSGDCGARKHGKENNNRNSDHAPGHGILPAAAPLRLRRK
jgi:hypothetical protein